MDNEKFFRYALDNGDYDDYFLDSFAGEFGHAIPEGNRILAENIADVLIKEVF